MDSWLFCRPPYSTLNDEHDNDYMINWPYFSNEISSKSTVTSRCQKVWLLRMDLPLFCRPPYSTSNEHTHSNLSFMHNSNHSHKHHSNHLQHLEINKKPPCSLRSLWGLIAQSLEKCHHCVWIWDISADPLTAHSMINMTMIIWSTDHIFLMKYHQNPQ